MLTIQNAKVNDFFEPLGIERDNIYFGWNIKSDKQSNYQESYRIIVRKEQNKELMWDTRWIKSSNTSYVPYSGLPLTSASGYFWQVSVRDRYGEECSSNLLYFETGLDEKDWKAKWTAPIQNTNIVSIEDIDKEKLLAMFSQVNADVDKNIPDRIMNPVSYMRKMFVIQEKTIKKARLYITAKGLYDVFVNSQNITDTVLNPGFTSYDHYLEYQVYDITGYLNGGENQLSVKLGEGWFKGKYGILGYDANYGKEISLLFQIIVSFDDGDVQTIVSDQSMECAEGPIRYSDLMVGEFYDARFHNPMEEWNRSSKIKWNSCYLTDSPFRVLRGIVAPPVKVLMKRKPVCVLKTPKGETVLDMGQNMVGYLEMKVTGERGREIKLEFSETLDKEGNFLNNISGYNRDQTDRYILSGRGEECWHPSFTVHGFRYVRITNYPEPIDKDSFTGFVIGTSCEKSGEFRCSDERLNQLQSNIVWSQRGNFLSIPTDCPQRERAGWTGDVLTYCDTASFNADTFSFYRKWLANLRCDQRENGVVPIVVPFASGYSYIQKDLFGTETSAGWGDVIIYLPWHLYQQYGNIDILKENYPAMKKWIEYVENQASENVPAEAVPSSHQKYLCNTGFHFGDWLYPSCKNENNETDMFGSAANTMYPTATILFAMSCAQLVSIADVLGYNNDANYYRDLHKKICQAFEKEYVDSDGIIKNDLQGLYVMALAGNVVSQDKAILMAKHLDFLIRNNGYRLDTGFMSTKYLMDVLMKYGYSDTAKRILYQEECPSWLYEVKHQATTMWETWDAVRPDGTPGNMSYNHYAFGCIGDWMYRSLLGIQKQSEGFKTFSICPELAFGLSEATGWYDSVNGRIQFSWAEKDGEVSYSLNVPDNTRAKVYFPMLATDIVFVNGTENIVSKNEPLKYIECGSGKYDIKFTITKKKGA